MDGARGVVEGLARADRPLVQHGVAGDAELEPGPPGLDIPGLVLALVVLETEGVPGRDEADLADVGVRLRPDQLPAPRLLDPPRVECPGVEAVQVRRGVDPAILCRFGRGEVLLRATQ